MTADRKRVDWKQRAMLAEREVRRLRKIEHAAWHALDNAAEYPDRGHAEIAWRDWKALSKLLPLEHPEPTRITRGDERGVAREITLHVESDDAAPPLHVTLQSAKRTRQRKENR